MTATMLDAANTIDTCQTRLHDEGFSIGDMAARTARGCLAVIVAYCVYVAVAFVFAMVFGLL
jgi:hypothetical protein